MIFIIPCKYNPNCKIVETVESIALYHPTAQIFVVDSDSEDKTYLSRINHLAMVIDEGNKNYEPGALWRVTSTFPAEHYVLIQDSMVFKQSITEIVESTETLKCFINFHETVANNHMRVSEMQFNESLNKMMNTRFSGNFGYLGVFGSSFIAHRRFIQKLYDRNLHSTLLPTNKFEHQIAERVFGIVATLEDIDLMDNTIIGNLHELMNGIGFDPGTETLNTPIFDKTWNNKHRQ